MEAISQPFFSIGKALFYFVQFGFASGGRDHKGRAVRSTRYFAPIPHANPDEQILIVFKIALLNTSSPLGLLLLISDALAFLLGTPVQKELKQLLNPSRTLHQTEI